MGMKAMDVSAFCTQCGASNPNSEIFCGSCGFNLEKQVTPSTGIPYVEPPQQRDIGAPQQPYQRPQFHPRQSYSVSWQDATKITIGVLLIIAGVGFGFFGLAIFAFAPFIGFAVLILLTAIPVFLGYSLLKGYMDGGEMIKTSISSFILGFLAYIYGIFVFIFMIIFFFDDFLYY
ncbi:MAG: zinc-ribbon domain-containing protein [Candidatus Heimdallarchaeota archaeon]|nr:zinc-ribbon domain-containing protein [Candidatus Heimdallarchaeota archaeon]